MTWKKSEAHPRSAATEVVQERASAVTTVSIPTETSVEEQALLQHRPIFDAVDSVCEPPVPLRLDLLRLSQNFHHHNVIGSYVVVTRIGDSKDPGVFGLIGTIEHLAKVLEI